MAVGALALLLSACASVQEPAVVDCSAEARVAVPTTEMLRSEPAPVVPDPDDPATSQEDVAGYLIELEAWGRACSLRQDAARAWVERQEER